MPNVATVRADGPSTRRTMKIAAACRVLEIDRATLNKWASLGYIRIIVIGPPGHEQRRIPVSEVERLRPS